MQIAQIMAGYSLGEADLLRRAMGKKKKEEMDQQRASSSPAPRSEASTADLAGHLRTHGQVRRLRLQQVPCRALRPDRLPDRLVQSQRPVEFFAGSMSLDISTPISWRCSIRTPAGSPSRWRRRTSIGPGPTSRWRTGRCSTPWARCATWATRPCGKWGTCGRRAGRSRICSISSSGSIPGRSIGAPLKPRPRRGLRQHPPQSRADFASAERLLAYGQSVAADAPLAAQSVRRRQRRGGPPALAKVEPWPQA